MDIRTAINFEVVKKDAHGKDQVFSYQIPWGASYQDSYDAAIEISNEIMKKSHEALDQAAQETSETKESEGE